MYIYIKTEISRLKKLFTSFSFHYLSTMFAPIATLLLAGLVAADSTTTKVDVNQFSNLYNGPYSSAMVSYAAYLADQGFNASYISTVLNAYNYGTNTMDQTSYIQFLSQNAAEQNSIASVRATESFSFAKETGSDSSDEVPNTDSGAASATDKDDDKSASATASGSKSKASGSASGSGSGSGSGSSSRASGSSESGSSNSAGSGSSSSEGNGANFAAPIGAALGAVAIALL